MHGRPLLLALALAAACFEDRGRLSTGTGATGVDTLPLPDPETMSSSAGSTGPTSGTTAADATSSTSGDDSFPETSVVSWFETTTGVPVDCEQVLQGVVRDFSAAHPDFEYMIGNDPGIVLPDLGADRKPVYAGQADNPTTTGQANFDQWYRDVPGVNQSFPLPIQLVDGGDGVFGYDTMAFFPIDGLGFGDEGNPHNYHFTLEIHTEFQYKGGEVFRFRGDDDVWVFINDRLAIDLGGVHGPLSGEVALDAFAAQAGMSPGGVYPLDFFFAERHTEMSNFKIETTIACLKPPG